MGLPDYLAPYGVFSSTYGITFCDEGTEEDIQRFSPSSATRTIVCSWQDRITLINNLGGLAQLNPFNQFSYTLAASYPDAPRLLFFNSLKSEGVPVNGLTIDPNGLVGYDLARCRINYRAQPYVEGENGTLAVKFATSDGLYSQTQNTWAFDSTSGTAVDPSQMPATELTITSIAWTVFNLLSIPTSTIYSACQNPIDQSGLFGTTTGQLRFTGADTVRRVNQAGFEMWDATYSAMILPVSWNKAFNSADGTYHPVVNTQTGNPPYALDNSGAIPSLFGNVSY